MLAPVALALDAAAALGLAGHSFPMGVIVPDAVLLAVPLLVYGSLAFVALRGWPVRSRLAAAAVLLGIHAGLVALHAVGYAGLWSLSLPAALRLAHAGSPFIPLLQLAWVPILALPLATLVRSRPRPASPRRGPGRIRVAAPVSPAPHAAPRGRTRPDGEARPDTGGAGVAPAAPAVAPEPASSPSAAAVLPPTAGETPDEVRAMPPPPAPDGRTLAPRPTWFDDIVGTSVPAASAALPSAEAAREARTGDEPATMPVALTPATDGAAEDVGAPARQGDGPEADRAAEDESPRVADPAPAVEIPVPDGPAAAAAPSVAGPPLDLELVARSFAPYGALLSRDRLVVVDWAPDPDSAVVCVAPRDVSRGRVVRLAGRLASVLEAATARSTPGPIRRLSLRGADGVVVLTPLGGAVLVAAARRRGALALLEALSARVVPGRGGSEAAAPEPAAIPATSVDLSVTGTVRVAVPGAMLDVLAPVGIAAASVGELAGRLLAAIALDGDGPHALHALSVDLGACRLMIQPVHPDARPPRFVAVVGAPERPGLLGRRTERAARALCEAS